MLVQRGQVDFTHSLQPLTKSLMNRVRVIWMAMHSYKSRLSLEVPLKLIEGAF